VSSNARPVAIVTAGSRGIGRAVVLELAREGHDVGFCFSRDCDAAEETQAEARKFGARILAQRADVTDSSSVRRFVADTERQLGPIDVVVTSAGITRDIRS
jgi:3-oxoacyl-[acyl-carrier protein] reductase